MRNLIIAIAMLISTGASAAKMVHYNPSATDVPGKVTEYFKSASASAHAGHVNCITQNDLTGFVDMKTRKPVIPWRHWKVSSGTVVEMTQAEKDAVDAPPVKPTCDATQDGEAWAATGETCWRKPLVDVTGIPVQGTGTWEWREQEPCSIDVARLNRFWTVLAPEGGTDGLEMCRQNAGVWGWAVIIPVVAPP